MSKKSLDIENLFFSLVFIVFMQVHTRTAEGTGNKAGFPARAQGFMNFPEAVENVHLGTE